MQRRQGGSLAKKHEHASDCGLQMLTQGTADGEDLSRPRALSLTWAKAG